MPETTVFLNASILDCTGKDPFPNGALVVSGERIQAVGPMDRVSLPRDARVVDLGGKTIMPGLIDAHAHVALVGSQISGFEGEYPGAVFAFAVARNIENYLIHGFTTIRDAGGCDWSFKLAVQRGMIKGPRIFISNSFISQTGGHGDHRQRYERFGPHSEHPLMAPPAIADGVDEVRRAAREQLRTGADQVKVMAGGGASSPTDALDVAQYTVEELAAAVFEASAARKYVMAHVYVPAGIRNCVEAGIRSIEHGNFLDEETASLMKMHDMFLVPTLSIFDLVASRGQEYGAPKSLLEKTNMAKSAGPQGVEIAMAAGVKIGSGSDVWGPYAEHRSLELELKTAIMGPMASIISATRTNAELLGIADDTGTLEVGKLADLIAVDGDPLADIKILQDERKIPLVVQSGRIVKEPGK